MPFTKIELKPNEFVRIPVGQTNYLYVDNCDKEFMAQTEEGEELKIKTGAEYSLEKCNFIELTNPYSEVVDLEFFTSNVNQYKSNALAINGIVETRPLTPTRTENSKFDISVIEKILDVNTGRKVATLYNNSEDTEIILKANDSTDIASIGMPLKPLSSIDIVSSASYYAVAPAGTANLRIEEVSY
tara:strand:- start:543 stop:1100 length:558 start_codon:yes stop_codon:yes gene_type:complete